MKLDSTKMKIPVLILLFNRPNETKKLLDCLSDVRPSKLFVVVDGPRPEIDGEVEKCKIVRSLISSINWKCELKTTFRPNNLGCRKSVSLGIHWFFEHVDQGIILEDDCIPDKSFFGYCSELLEKYRFDSNVMHIGGNNFQYGKIRSDGDYYFSIHNHVWGWATWRRAWIEYTEKIDVDKFEEIRKFVGHQATWNYFRDVFEKLAANQIDTWDFYWTYSCWNVKGISIIPNKNLVTNIGFGKEATHTKDPKSIQSKIPAEKMSLPLKHPTTNRINKRADRYSFHTIFRPLKLKDRINLLKRKLKSK